MSSPITGRPVSEEVWESIRAEFTLPSLEQVRRRLAELLFNRLAGIYPPLARQGA